MRTVNTDMLYAQHQLAHYAKDQTASQPPLSVFDSLSDTSTHPVHSTHKHFVLPLYTCSSYQCDESGFKELGDIGGQTWYKYSTKMICKEDYTLFCNHLLPDGPCYDS